MACNKHENYKFYNHKIDLFTYSSITNINI